MGDRVERPPTTWSDTDGTLIVGGLVGDLPSRDLWVLFLPPSHSVQQQKMVMNGKRKEINSVYVPCKRS